MGKLRPHIKSFFAVVLGLVYVIGFYHSSIDHTHHHAHSNQELHHPGCETDLCHVSIYHPNSNLGCDHKSHWTEAETPCYDCIQLIKHESIEELTETEVLRVSISSEFAWSPLHVYSAPQRVIHLRGPPSVV